MTTAASTARFNARRALIWGGFALVLIRYLEIFYRLFTHRQVGLGLADEAGERRV